MDFKGFDDWVEIFAGGRQNDSRGIPHNGTYLINKAIETFHPATHEPPIVVGHPADNAPAFGWVEGLKKGFRNGSEMLFAKFKQVDPQFEEAVKDGRYKKRSAAFYPDGRLRHVGFLGATPPAVKGLTDVQFSEEPFFSFGLTSTDSEQSTVKFTENELEEVLEKTRCEERQRLNAEFAEKDLQRQREENKKVANSFVAECVKGGIIPPSVANDGMLEFVEQIQDVPEFTFSEGEEKSTPFEWFKGFVGKLGKSPLFSEIATKDRVGKKKNKADELGMEIAQMANNNK